MTRSLKFDVFGKIMTAERADAGWQLFVLGADGKRSPADVVVPAFIAEHELAQYLDDIDHESASLDRPCVKRYCNQHTALGKYSPGSTSHTRGTFRVDAAVARTMVISSRQGQSHANVTETHHTGHCQTRAEESRCSWLEAVLTLPPLAGTSSEDT